MGAIRHRQLIQVLAFAVAVNLAVGVVALSDRRDGRDAVRTTLVAGSIGIPLNDETGARMLAGANLKGRRSSKKSSDATVAAGVSSTTRPPDNAVAAGPTATDPPTTTSRPPEMTTSTRPMPASTTTTIRAPGARRRPGRQPPVERRRRVALQARARPPPPATTATSGPAAANREGQRVAMTDPAGDTVVDGTTHPIKEARADIVRATGVYRSDGIVFAMQVQQPTDPRTDARWAGDSTFAAWFLDTNGDRTADYEIQYSVYGGRLGGTVTRAGQDGKALCDASAAGYGPDGYVVAVDPACLGNPASFSYAVTLYYDTNPKDDNAEVASDVAPNGGMSFPIARP